MGRGEEAAELLVKSKRGKRVLFMNDPFHFPRMHRASALLRLPASLGTPEARLAIRSASASTAHKSLWQ